MAVLLAVRKEVDAREESRKKAMNLSQMARAGVLERVQHSQTRIDHALGQLNASESLSAALQALAMANALVSKLVDEDAAAQLTYKRATRVHANMTRLAQKALEEELAELAKFRNASREHADSVATIKEKLEEEAHFRQAAENYSHATEAYERASVVAMASRETKERTAANLKALTHRVAKQLSEVTRLSLLQRQASRKVKQCTKQQTNAEIAMNHALVEWKNASATERKARIEAKRAQVDATKAIDEAAQAEKLGMNMTVWTAASEGKTAAYEPEQAPDSDTNMNDLFKFQQSSARAAAHQALETKAKAAAEARRAARDMALAVARSRKAESDKERASAQAVTAAVIRKKWEAKLEKVSDLAVEAKSELLRIKKDLAMAQSANTVAVSEYRRKEKELEILKASAGTALEREAAARAAARSAESAVKNARVRAQVAAKQAVEAKARAKQSAQLARDTLRYSKTWVKTMHDAKHEAKKASQRLAVAKERQDVAEAAAAEAERTQTWIRHRLQRLEFFDQVRVVVRVLDAMLILGSVWVMVSACFNSYTTSGARNYKYSRLRDRTSSDGYPTSCSILTASAFFMFACAPIILKALSTRTGCRWMTRTSDNECSISPLALSDLFCSGMMVCVTKFVTFLFGMSSSNLGRRRIDWFNWSLSLLVLLHTFLDNFAEHFVTEELWARSLVNGEGGVFVFAAVGAPTELLHKSKCLRLDSSDGIKSVLPLFFGWPFTLTFSLGALLICLGDAMILVGETDFDSMTWLDSCVLKIATTRELASFRTCDPSDRPTRLVLHRLLKVIWPFWLQALGLTLWLPVDLVRTQPCLSFNNDVTTVIATIMTTFGVSVAANSDYLMLVWKCTLGLVIVVLILIACQHADPLNMKVRGNISALTWCVVVAHCGVFGTFCCSTKYVNLSEFAWPDIGDMALGIIDLTSAHVRNIWLCSNVVQTFILCLSLNSECLLSCTVSEEEQQELQVEESDDDHRYNPEMDTLRDQKSELELTLCNINEEKESLRRLLDESIERRRTAQRELEDHNRSSDEQKEMLQMLQCKEGEWERKQVELQEELTRQQGNLESKQHKIEELESNQHQKRKKCLVF